jgi:hypothetical protein
MRLGGQGGFLAGYEEHRVAASPAANFEEPAAGEFPRKRREALSDYLLEAFGANESKFSGAEWKTKSWEVSGRGNFLCLIDIE